MQGLEGPFSPPIFEGLQRLARLAMAVASPSRDRGRGARTIAPPRASYIPAARHTHAIRLSDRLFHDSDVRSGRVSDVWVHIIIARRADSQSAGALRRLGEAPAA